MRGSLHKIHYQKYIVIFTFSKIYVTIFQFPIKFEGKSGDLFVHSAAGQFFDNATYCIVKSLSNNCHCNDQSLIRVRRKSFWIVKNLGHHLLTENRPFIGSDQE